MRKPSFSPLAADYLLNSLILHFIVRREGCLWLLFVSVYLDIGIAL